MKKLFIFTTLLLLMIYNFDLLAANYYTLYGVKIGQELKLIQKRFGKPDKIIPYEDGWKGYIYFMKNHNVIFETDNTHPDLIFSIQIEGESNPPNMGLDGINLGSDTKDALTKFGNPDNRRQPIDLITKKAINNSFINFYGNNFSFEEKDGVISSIKVIYSGPVKPADRPDFETFIQNIKTARYYQLGETISSDLKINGKRVVNGPIINEIIEKSELNNFLFGKNGLITLKTDDIADVNMRFATEDEKTGARSTTDSFLNLRTK